MLKKRIIENPVFRNTFLSSKYLSMLCSGTVMMILTAFMGIADTLIGGIMLGNEAVMGIALVMPVYSMASFFAVCFSYGVPILYAEKTGAFRREEADRCFGVGLTVASLAGLMMFLAVLFGGDAYLGVFHTDVKVCAVAREYLGRIKYVILILPLNELLDGMVFTDGDEKISLAANLARGIVKVVLSVVFCRIMKAKGLALGSLIGFAVSVFISCLHFFRPRNTLKLNFAFSAAVFRDIMKFGIVDASTHLFMSLFTFTVSLFVTAYLGPEMLILVSVISLFREGQILFEGIGEAIQPIVSIYLGEKTGPGIRKVWKLARLSLWIESLLCTELVLVFAPWVVKLLDIKDPAMTEYAVWGLRILSFTLIFTCRMFLDSSYFILVNRISLGVFDSFLRELFPALPLAVLGCLIGGVYGLFVGLMLAPPLGYLLSFLYVKHRYGRENYPLFLAEMDREKKIELYEFPVLPDSVARVRDQIGKALKERSFPDRQVNRVMVLFEELFMLIHECNPGRTVLAECALEMGDPIRLTTKDDGRILDLTDLDRDISSLRSYVFSNMLEVFTTRRVHFLALSYNRNALEIR